MDITSHAHLAAGWTTLAVCLTIALIFSWLFVLWLRSVRANESSTCTNVTITFCLWMTFVCAGLVPVDVFIVSSFKDADGTYEKWAKDVSVRNGIMFHLQIIYYTLFCMILSMSFIILPLTFFFHTTSPLAEEDEEDLEETFGRKMCRAFKYTSASVMALVALILLGIFLPFETSPNVHNLSQYFQAEWQIFETNEGFEMVVFVLNSVSVVGLFLLVIYTSIGMSAIPYNLIKGTSGTAHAIGQIDNDINQVDGRLQELREGEDELNAFEQEEAQRLENELQQLNRQKSELQESTRNWAFFCYRMSRPVQLILGLIFLSLLVLIFSSLLLNNIDKAMHANAKSGYVLKNGTLPNPMDMSLVRLQNVFPLDYILYNGMVLLFLASSISGIFKIGIRFMWLPLYKVKPHSTKPQALALVSLTLILILMASNILFFAISPDYTTYGSQRFVKTDYITNSTEILHCNNSFAPHDECTMTMISRFLLAFHTKAWIFGATYYWLTWIFLVTLFGFSFMTLFECCRRGQRSSFGDYEEDELLDNEA